MNVWKRFPAAYIERVHQLLIRWRWCLWVSGLVSVRAAKSVGDELKLIGCRFNEGFIGLKGTLDADPMTQA